jgi:hypothetical protein
MFYSHTILARKSPLGTVWIAAHLERKIKKPQIDGIDIPTYAGPSAPPLALPKTRFFPLPFPLSTAGRKKSRIFFSSLCFFGEGFLEASGGGLKVRCSLWPSAKMRWNHATQGQLCEDLVPNRHSAS